MNSAYRLVSIACVLSAAAFLCRCSDPFAYNPVAAPSPPEGGGVSADASVADDRDDTPIVVHDPNPGPDGSDATASDADSDAATDATSDASSAADAVSEPPPCDLTKGPHDEACVVDDPNGIFVSPAGSDDVATPGTRAHPVQTIGHAMVLAALAGKRVFVCAGTYPESLAVGTSRDGVSVYGALDCTTWAYAAANRVTVAPAQTGYALQVSDLQLGVTFEDVEFDARDGVTPGESSIAAFVRNAQNVALHRVVIVAGNGAGGAGAVSADGGVVTGGDAGIADAGSAEGGDAGGLASNHYAGMLDGIAATAEAGGPSTTCVCPDGVTASTGGYGGTRSTSSGSGTTPAPGLPSYGVAGAGTAGTNGAACNMAGGGGNGADAPSPSADTPNTSSGMLATSGWSPAAGTQGSDGFAGQGGGGGGYGSSGTGSGGSGACGGCGGAGGKAGRGGGASIALLVVQSTVSVVGSTLTANSGGNGAPGGVGEAGQAGGYGGYPSGAGCLGGGGGTGSGGNGGQGGAGGLSLGVGWQATSPTIDGSNITAAPMVAGITVGKAGLGGAKGTAGPAAPLTTGHPGNDGAAGKDGVAQAVVGL